MNYIPLTQVCDFQGGSQPPKEQWIDHAEEGYIRMLQIRDFTQPDKDNIEYVRITKTVKTCNEDDILIGRYGASVGKILTGLSGAYNVAIIKTIPDASKLTKRFLYHYLNSPYFQSFILSVGSRAAQAGFNKEDLSDAQIPQLSLKEQEYVTARLDKIVDLIALRKQQLSKLDELVKSRFIELFGTVTENPYGFPMATLKEVCHKITDGKHGGCEQEADSGYYYVGAREIYDDCIHYDTAPQITYADFAKDYKRCNIERGDMVIVNTGATIGKTAIATSPLTERTLLQKSIALLKVKTEIISAEFLRHCYMANPSMYKVESASAQPNLLLSRMNATRIYLPPIDLQEQFAAFVEQTDKSKFEIQKSLEKLETLKKALMQKNFG